jgi:hypothetical protein
MHDECTGRERSRTPSRVSIMKTRISLILGIIGLIFVIVVYQCFNAYTISSDQPHKPSNLPQDAFWSGGMDGGAWYVVTPEQTQPDVWNIKIYTDDGRPWVRGNFWWKAPTKHKLPLPISSFDGHVIHLEDNERMLPVGEHFYPQKWQNTLVVLYPSPDSSYNELTKLNKRSAPMESW